MKKILLLLLCLALITGAYFLYRFLTTQKHDITTITEGPIVAAVYGTGVVESRKSTIISPLVSGRLLHFHKKEGDLVKKGDVLAELDNREAQSKVDSIKAQIAFQKSEVARQKTLLSKNFTSAERLEEKSTQLERLSADLDAALKNLEEFTLRSPMDGMVLRRESDEGEIIQPGKQLFWIGQPKNLRIEAEVDEEGFPEITLGQKTLIKADAFPDEKFEGIVEDITPLGNSQNKNYRLHIGLDSDVPFAIGMTVECNVLTKEKENVLLAPNSAIKKQKLWTVDQDDVIHEKKIKTGIIGDSFTEMVEGVAKNERILIQYKDNLEEGQKIRPQLKKLKIK